MKETWYNLDTKEVQDKLGVSDDGLSTYIANTRLAKYGPNKLPEAKSNSTLDILFEQFRSPLIYLLAIASVIVILLGEYADGFLIIFVLVLNAIIGTIQEGKAQNTLLALRKMVETNTTAIRNGQKVILQDTELVPGDLVIIQEGEKVPGDARIIHSNNLRVNESALTGESNPIQKTAASLKSDDLEVFSQSNMIFKGTNILAGNGEAVIVETGPNTVIGKISRELTNITSEIPLRKNIQYLSKIIVITVGIISVLLLLLGIATGKPLPEMFQTIVSLAVSIIPEGLPIVTTLVLANGVKRMSKRKALVKKLEAVESLGQTSIIAVDKTGTITKNELVIREVFTGNGFFSVTGEGYSSEGVIKALDGSGDYELLGVLARHSVLSSNASLIMGRSDDERTVSGDPTEAAMLVFGEKAKVFKDEVVKSYPKLAEIPFDYKTRIHTVVHQADNKEVITVSGAPENVIKLCKTLYLSPHKQKVIMEHDRRNIEDAIKKMSEEGLRVVAVAETEKSSIDLAKNNSYDLCFIGLLGMKDALRLEVPLAMSRANSAGIKVVMITGDYTVTAKAIAKDAGIYHDGDMVLTGDEIDKLSSNELSKRLSITSVFSRVTPEHKLKIIEAYKKRGEVIAMTGDGVNDAPSLVAADLGISMGKAGTEVAKEASDIVLEDDNFGTIIVAVEEGRAIYRTIKKVILYLFSTGMGELLTIVGAIIVGLPLPILPAQIIWLNLVTDGFLDVSLAMEPNDKDLLKSKASHPTKYFVDRLMATRILTMSLSLAIGTLLLFSYYYHHDIAKAWTMSLSVLAVSQWFNAWNCRSEKDSIFTKSFLSNKYLIAATFTVMCLQFLAIYTPFMQKILHTTALKPQELLIVVAVASLVVIVEEVRKYFSRL